MNRQQKKSAARLERNGANESTSDSYHTPPQTQCTILKINHRNDKSRPYTRILNKTLRDHRLGGMARGVLCYALSRPSNWKLRSWELAKEFRCGEWAIRSAMKELVNAGYARLDLVRTPTGTVEGRAWLIRESPEMEWPRPRRGFQVSDEDVPGFGASDDDMF